ncbi:MAG: hypothetical protein E6Q59_01625 [Nitrosomonas sp.]|nr:hypothetical protein [Nitrosomonas sp.]TXI41789.1 MAG: hypothetical protein E6Q59_01625 [Nitrosomonas sp.]
MSDENYLPTKAECLAGLVTGTAKQEFKTASVQRSHRFPLHLFLQIENLARISNVSVSVIINELLECGLEALNKELPPEFLKQAKFIPHELLNKHLPEDLQVITPKRKSKLRSVKPTTEK